MKRKKTSVRDIVIIGLLAILAFLGTILVLKQLQNGTNPLESVSQIGSQSNTNGDSASDTIIPDGTTGSSTDIIGSSVDLIPTARSIRSLEGLLVQINQIDDCRAPNIDVYANLTDAEGRAFSNLNKEDFSVYEDNSKINSFTFSQLNQQEVPLAVTLVIDMSGSMKGVPMTRAKEAAADFTARLSPNDSVAIVTFDDKVETRLPMTTDKNKALSVINAIATRGDTALYDAVAAGAEQAPDCGRSAVIALSDGADTASKTYTVEKAINEANLKNTPTYVIGLKSSQFNPTILKNIAESTGAQYFEAPTPQDLTTVYTTITQQLRSQYRFRYTSAKSTGDHRVRIESKADGADTSSEKSYRR